MLANAPVYVSLPTTGLPRARYFYETVLGLAVQAVGGPEPGNPDLRGRVVHRAGAGTVLSIYERPSSPAEHTAAFFVVDDFDQTLVELPSRGLAFVDYDLPHVKTQDGVLAPAMPGGGPGSTTRTATCSACSSSRSSPPHSANDPVAYGDELRAASIRPMGFLTPEDRAGSVAEIAGGAACHRWIGVQANDVKE